MEWLNNIEDGVLIVPFSLKKRILTQISTLCSVKIYSTEEFYKQFYFEYDARAIVYLTQKYSFSYDVACMYLSLLYEVEGIEHDSYKVQFIKGLKKELDAQNLLIFNPFFVSFLQHKKVYLYGYIELDDLLKRTITKIEEICPIQVMDCFHSHFSKYPLYALKDKDAEIHFVANSILDLYKNGITFSKIQLTNVPSSYYVAIERIFSIYHIPISVPLKGNLYATKMGKDFFRFLNANIQNTMDELLSLYSYQNPLYQEIYEKIIMILNRYAFIGDYTTIVDLLVCEFQRTKLDRAEFIEQVQIVSLDEVDSSKYVFVMSFNEGVIPFTYKDEEYFSDALKDELGFDSSIIKNKKERNRVVFYLSSLNHAIFSYKLKDGKDECYLSSLASFFSLEVSHYQCSYQHSNLANQLELAIQLDTFYKYGHKMDDLSILYAHYHTFPYCTYHHEFTSIDSFSIPSLTFSYSSLDCFYHCPFRYYVEYILKLSSYSVRFERWIGRMYHDILSKIDTDFSLEEQVEKYKLEHPYEFLPSEQFFLEKLVKELEELLFVIKEQHRQIGLKHVLYEQPVMILDTDFSFTGIMDKVFYDDTEEGKVIALIDYKTGDASLDLYAVAHGLNMQLPIYLYLLSSYFKDEQVFIAGFYVQKILSTTLLKEGAKEVPLIQRYKLQGFSNQNESILKQFDFGYADSHLIQGMKLSSKGFYTYSKVLSNEDMDHLICFVQKKIQEATKQILDGQFPIAPKHIGGKLEGCKYCTYHDLCFCTPLDYVYLEEYQDLSFLEVE